MSDPRKAALEFALRKAAHALLSHEIAMQEAISVVATAMSGTNDETPRELAAAAHQDHRARVLAEIARLEQQGKGRLAAKHLARLNAADADDLLEVETLANKYRRWGREEKRAHARLPASR